MEETHLSRHAPAACALHVLQTVGQTFALNVEGMVGCVFISRGNGLFMSMIQLVVIVHSQPNSP